MKRFVVGAVVVLFSGYLCAQPKPKSTTWKGTLTDSGCPTSQSEAQKATGDLSSSRNAYAKITYGLITADGKCIPLDVSSNEKVIGVLKARTDWSENTAMIKPTKVEVIGTQVGGKIAVDNIQIK
jgi:hypothetical protein